MNFQTSKDLVKDLLAKRAGPFSPLTKLFAPHLDLLRIQTGLKDGTIPEIIFNAENNLYGRGKCEICEKETKLYVARGGWAKYCGKVCMNSKDGSRHKNSEVTKQINGTSIGASSIREKAEKTCVERYGVNNPSLAKEVQEKRAAAFYTRFGTNTPLKHAGTQQKIKSTMIAKYGGTGNGSLLIGKKITDSKRLSILHELSIRLPEWSINTSVANWDGCQGSPLSITHNCGNTIEKWVWTGRNLFDPICPKCHASKPQKKIIDLLNSLRIQYDVNDRKIISPKELDIVIPSKNLAIEINGLYWHGELAGKDKKYHLTKTEEAAAVNYQLIHLTDRDIIEKWCAVEMMLKAKLGLLPKQHARKLCVKELSATSANEFLKKYHLQSYAKSSIKLGLVDMNGDIISVATFGKSRFDNKENWELIRFASTAAVRGGASKLIKAFQKMVGHGKLISFADRRWSQGNLYETLGFKLECKTSPGYWYFNQTEFHHRTKFQRHKIKEHPELTEWSAMQKLGWDRIWDCGSLKYSLSF
ncbi:hypothetical protein [Acinetobacter sp.]|uniref:DUF7487 domain-containing protein n=1 Tax=Acinetobacter sp. TaxID=472 RepID=UPI00388DD8F3